MGVALTKRQMKRDPMTDIRKRTGAKGVTYQVRYPTRASKSGYAYKTFDTPKKAHHYASQAP